MGAATKKCPATWYRHAGDQNDTIKVEVSKALGDNLDVVTGVSAVLEDARGTLADVPLTASVTDSAAREVTVELGTWLQNDAIVDQQWWVSLLITAGSLGPITFPERKSARLGLHIL